MRQATWYERLTLARSLNDSGDKLKAYMVYKDISIDSFRFDKYRYGTYEDYIVDKVKFLIEIALLEVEFVKENKDAVGYLEYALELLDGMESVYPYVKIEEVKNLKESIQSIKQ